MHFFVDREFVRQVLGSDGLLPEDVRSILRLAYLTAEIDFDEDIAEREALQEVAGCLWDVAGSDAQAIEPVSPIPLDGEERSALIHRLAAELPTRGARELAYVTAYLLATSDLELAPIEGRFLEELQDALGLDDDHAADLAASAAESVTPEASTIGIESPTRSAAW
jgi:tellurite resistance protein